MTISKGMFISQADMGLQAVNVLEKYKKHLEEEGASEEKQAEVIKAIKYCQDCADASHIIMAALDWQAAQNGKPAEDTPEEAPVEKPKEAPKRKTAPRKKAAPKAEEKPKEEPAPTLFDAPLEKPAEAPKAEEVKEPPKEEPKPQEIKAEEPAADDSLDDLF